jgi:hypothetical protein
METMDCSSDALSKPGAFDRAMTDDGRVDAKALAQLLDLPMSTVAPALGLTHRALEINPTAPKAQPAARRLLTAMNELALNLTEGRYAVSWLKTPYSAFGGQTAADWLTAGDLDGVCTHIDRLVRRQPD